MAAAGSVVRGTLPRRYRLGGAWRSYLLEVPWRSYQLGDARRSYQPGGVWHSYHLGGVWRSYQPGGTWRSYQLGGTWRSCQPGGTWRSYHPGAARRNNRLGGAWQNWKPWNPSPLVVEECEPFNLTERDNEVLKLLMNDLTLYLRHTETDETTTFYDLPRPLGKGTGLGVQVRERSVLVSRVAVDGPDLEEAAAQFELPGPLSLRAPSKVVEAVARSLERFAKEQPQRLATKLPVGITLALQTQDGGLGRQAGQLARSELLRRLRQRLGARLLELKTLLPDSTGTLLAGHWLCENIASGFTLGEGLKASYLPTNLLEQEGHVSVRKKELGRLGDADELEYLRTQHDVTLDLHSSNPGLFRLEKLLSDKQLGELTRIVLLKLASDGALFGGRVTAPLMTPGLLPTAYLEEMERDAWGRQERCARVLRRLHLEPTRQDCVDARYVSEAVTRRAAHIAAAAVAAHGGCAAAVDGSLLCSLPGLLPALGHKLNQLAHKNVKLIYVARSSVIGAAVMALRLSEIEAAL